MEKRAASAQRLVLTFHDINFEKNPGVGYEVYVNLPPGAKPDYKSPYYVGTLHFFGLKHSREQAHEAAMEFDISEVVAYLKKNNQWKDQINITYVPVAPRPKEKPAAEIRLAAQPKIGRVTLTQQ